MTKEQLREFFGYSNDAKPDCDPIIISYIPEKHIDEISYHEAGHLIIGVLVQKLNLGFKPLDSIYVKISENKFEGHVYGNTPNVDENRFLSVKPWFLEERKRIIANIFSTIAGYTTYKVFINDNREKFIGIKENLNRNKENLNRNKEELDYYNLRCALKKSAYSTAVVKSVPLVKDFNVINRMFYFLDMTNIDKKELICEELINDLAELMRNPSVINAFGYVKNRLILENGNEIEGYEFFKLLSFVEGQLRKVSVKNLLSKYENKIQ